MKRTRVVAKIVVAVAAVAAVWGTRSAVTAGPVKCPALWAPVICDNGRVYPNQCYADKQGGKNCVPYEDGL